MTLMLVTNVEDEMYWWLVLNLGNRSNTLKKYQYIYLSNGIGHIPHNQADNTSIEEPIELEKEKSLNACIHLTNVLPNMHCHRTKNKFVLSRTRP